MLADAIVEEHGLDPAVREQLCTRIAGAVDEPNVIAAIKRDYGSG